MSLAIDDFSGWVEMMDLIESSLGIRRCSLELFQRYFRRKIGGKSCSSVLGGCESDERGVSDPARRLLYYNSI